MPQFDAVLFDLDGTLLYTLPDIAESLNRALESRGYPAHGLEAVRGFVGNGGGPACGPALPGGADNPDYTAVRRPTTGSMPPTPATAPGPTRACRSCWRR